MNPPLPGRGEAVALQRRLPGRPDPLALYAALSDNGRRADTLLIERGEGTGLLIEQAAVRAECRGQEAVLQALTDNGRRAIAAVAGQLPAFVAALDSDRLVLRFERPDEDDAEARILAPSPFDALRALAFGIGSLSPEEPFTLAASGVVAFDHVELFETLPAVADPLGFPDFLFWLAESAIVFEPGAPPRAVCTAFGSGDAEESLSAYFSAAERLSALLNRCDGIVPRTAPKAVSAPRPETDLDDETYAGMVSALKRHIAAGDAYQIVLSRTFRASCPDPLRAFAALRAIDPSPYLFYVAGAEHILFGASPETSVRVAREQGWPTLEVKPIAGTRPRGASPDEDDRLEAELRLDGKELAEHMMLVDLARNDVARVSMRGQRRVAKLMTVERYARVMHLVSSVKGPLGIGYDALHALQACLNVGTLSGAPKVKATELLRRAEGTRRGPYGGAVGWISGDGAMDTGVVIRAALVKDGVAYVCAGAGIVHDSDPSSEADETRRKAAAVLGALAAAEALS